LRCILETQHPGHSQPITALDLLGNVLFTGSQDHTLKVFHTDSNTLHFTLHGHCSPITTLVLDHFQAGTACSGSQNGLLCLWDVVTGK
jgi:WD40 repeat protein